MSRFAAIIYFVLFLSLPGLTGEIPVGTPSADNLFLLIRELYGRGLIDQLEYSNPQLTETVAVDYFEKNLLEGYRFLMGDYRSRFEASRISNRLEIVEAFRKRASSKNYIKFFPHSRIDFSENFSATIAYRIDRELNSDPHYEGKYWDGWAGFAENATVHLRLSRIEFRFGLERLSWGFGQYGNLMFSRQAMPMTIFGISFKRGNFDFESITGFLNPTGEELDHISDDPGYHTGQQRYISAHSLSYSPFDKLSLSLREAIVYGGLGRRFEPAYSFPLIWYHGYQLNTGMDDNALMGFAFDFRDMRRLWIYGEILVDDFQIEKKSRGDFEPDQLGFLIGGEFYDIGLTGSTVRFEYARINNWTYNQGLAHNRFINRNLPIGFPDGPDNDIFNWEYSWWIFGNARIAYYGSYQRKGEGDIDSPWSTPWLYVDDYSEPFPTGTIQRVISNGLRMFVFYKNRFWGKLEVQMADINNDGNVPGLDKDVWQLSIDIGCKLPPLGWGI